MSRTWKQGLLAAPGIGVALLPKLACPLCWPLYAGIVSSLGLGFLVSTTYLLPITVGFMALTIGVLAFRASRRRGYGPVLLGIAAAAGVLIGKFSLDSGPMMYGGIALLVEASVWNALPRRVVEACACKSAKEGE